MASMTTDYFYCCRSARRRVITKTPSAFLLPHVENQQQAKPFFCGLCLLSNVSVLRIVNFADEILIRALADDHFRADPHPFIEVDDILVAHPDTAGRYGLADGPGLIGAVNAI